MVEGRTLYGTIQAASNAAPAAPAGTPLLREGFIVENSVDVLKELNMQGGWDCVFGLRTSNLTRIQGVLTIGNNGLLVADGIGVQ